ncbi:TetR/AcrR family transcriptional regulator [Nevskia sp.]|uniref:TetR/AcrR family transcriptional regulator n=1 Tax=Nevskia sp. TaxID=1929292 RepID=UPI0025EC5755|nr:TetR/AcrR family transcriptional regulator [Nevskia sp.]
MARAQLSSETVTATRQKLLALALDIHRAEGLDAISFRRLAEAAGISHTLPYRYFESKEALLVALRVVCFQRFETHVREREKVTAPLPLRIRSVAEAYVSFVEQHPAEYQLIFSTHQPPPDQYPDLLAARRSLFDHAIEVVQAGIDDGLLHGDARALTHLFWLSLHGLMSLHVGGQLVHGCGLSDLIEPLVARIIGSDAPKPMAMPKSASTINQQQRFKPVEALITPRRRRPGPRG